MSNALELPAVLDLVAAPILYETFTSRRGAPLALDAGGVQRLGAQCLQVLLAARAAWAADGVALVLDNLSEDFATALELMGAHPDDLRHGAGQEDAGQGGAEQNSAGQEGKERLA